MQLYIATYDDHEDPTEIVGVYATLALAQLGCGDHDRYAMDDEEGDDRLEWDESYWPNSGQWDATGEDDRTYRIQLQTLVEADE